MKKCSDEIIDLMDELPEIKDCTLIKRVTCRAKEEDGSFTPSGYTGVSTIEASILIELKPEGFLKSLSDCVIYYIQEGSCQITGLSFNIDFEIDEYAKSYINKIQECLDEIQYIIIRNRYLHRQKLSHFLGGGDITNDIDLDRFCARFLLFINIMRKLSCLVFDVSYEHSSSLKKEGGEIDLLCEIQELREFINQSA